MEWKLNTPSDWDWESLSVCSASTIQTPHRHPLQINYSSHTEEGPNANPLVPDKPMLDNSSPCSQERAKTSGETPVLRRPSASRASSSTQNCSRCQVEGCNLDLTSAKEYHRRHRICAHHSKSPRVIVAGMERRFCQQCSRFHDLSEFDDKKRSCRRRLSAHNARRRRPRPFHEFATSSSSSSSLSFSGATGVMSSSVMTPELRRAFSLLSTSSTVFNEAEPAASFGQFVHHGSNISLATHPGMPMPLENWEPSAFSQNIFG